VDLQVKQLVSKRKEDLLNNKSYYIIQKPFYLFRAAFFCYWCFVITFSG